MAEFVRQGVRTIKVFAKCNICGGVLHPTGVCLTSDPPQYQHKCTECGNTKNFNCCYPKIEYEDYALQKEADNDWHRIAELNAKRVTELEAENKAMQDYIDCLKKENAEYKEMIEAINIVMKRLV